MGRPKLEEDTRRVINFTLRLNGSEMKQLEEAAKICAQTPTALIRAKLFKGKFPAAKTAKLDNAIYYELKKIGVNLNQLTRLAHAGRVNPALLTVLMKLLQQQETIIIRLIYDSGSADR